MATAHVAIIGGGVIGTSIAWMLTELSVHDIVLFERQSLASGATGVCPGGLRQQFEGEADCVLARHSLRAYEHLSELVGSDMAFPIERSGYLFLADSEARLSRFRRNVAMQNRLGIPSEIVSVADLSTLVPALRTEGLVGGAYCAEDGFLEDCHGVTAAFADRARQRGARILYEEVVGLRPIHQRWHVETASGDRTEVEHVVVAAGVDAVKLLEPIVRLPIRAERRRLAFSAPAPQDQPRDQLRPLTVALERGFAGKQLSSGVFYMGWLGESPDADDLTFIEETMTRGATLLPWLVDLPVRRVMSGTYDNTPDRRPVLGSVPGVERLWLATGFSGHGFMIAPAVAELVARAITGQPPTLPAEPFALARFGDQSANEGLFI